MNINYFFSLVFSIFLINVLWSQTVNEFKFDEASGSIVSYAQSGGATINMYTYISGASDDPGGATITDDAERGRVLGFCNSDNYAQISSLPNGANDWSISFWFYKETNTNGNAFTIYDSNGKNIRASSDEAWGANGFRVYIQNHTTSVEGSIGTSSQLAVNQWHHLTFIFKVSTGTALCYLNGTLEETNTSFFGGLSSFNFTNGYLGQYWGGSALAMFDDLNIGNGTADCNGKIGGTAYLDNCNTCVGGNTGYFPCVDIADDTYQISNLNSSLCLNNSSSYVEQYTCDPNYKWQVWQVTEEQTGWYSIVNPANGERFVASSMSNSTPINSWSSSDPNQYLFRFEQGTNGAVRVVPKASMDKLLDMPGWSTAEGTNTTIYDRYDQPNQQWIFNQIAIDCTGIPGGSAYIDNCDICVGGDTGGTPCVQDCNEEWGGSAYLDNCDVCVGGDTGYLPCVAIADDTYHISNLSSSLCLNNSSIEVKQYTCDPDYKWMLWQVTEEQTGWYSIVNPANGDKLGVYSLDNSTPINSYATTDPDKYLFRFEEGTNGAVRVVPKTSMDKLLDMPGASLTEGTSATIYDRYNTATNQQWVFTSHQPTLILNADVLLQGACINPNSGEENMMRDDLRTSGYVPTTSPYSDNLTCTATVFDVTGSDAIVDWIWVELRDKENSSQVVASRSGLLQRDGDIVNEDGISTLRFRNQPMDDYYIAIKHRNHLGIITQSIVSLSVNTIAVDFTDASNPVTYGTNAQTSYGMPSNTLGMWSGDTNGDGRLNYTGSFTESTAIRGQVYNDPNNSVFGGPPSPGYSSLGYHTTDVDLNGATKYTGGSNDISPIRNNTYNNPSNSVFGGPPSPGYVFIQQLPEGANN